MFIVIAGIFGFKTENSLYAAIMLNIVFGTLAVALFKTAHVYRDKYPNIVYLNIIGAFCIAGMIYVWFMPWDY
jgi:hypothetical protein